MAGLYVNTKAEDKKFVVRGVWAGYAGEGTDEAYTREEKTAGGAGEGQGEVSGG
jgi:hypothetical protein